MKINALTTKYTIFTRDAKEMNNEHSYIRRYTFKIEKRRISNSKITLYISPLPSAGQILQKGTLPERPG